MGRIKNLLYQKEIKPKSDNWADMYSFEVCEDFHLHWKNLRLQFSQDEWQHFTQAVAYALQQWEMKGCPPPLPHQKLPIYLKQDPNKVLNVQPEHDIRGTDFSIEDDDLNGPSVHVHYRSLRLDLSHPEFLEMAEGFAEALKKYKEIYGETR